MMRNLMSAAFKDNSSLFKGIITGILRVSKEGMFSGLNNIDVYSLLSDRFAQYFGFTQEEVDGLLAKTKQPGNRQSVRALLNGFLENFFDDTCYSKKHYQVLLDSYGIQSSAQAGRLGSRR